MVIIAVRPTICTVHQTVGWTLKRRILSQLLDLHVEGARWVVRIIANFGYRSFSICMYIYASVHIYNIYMHIHSHRTFKRGCLKFWVGPRPLSDSI